MTTSGRPLPPPESVPAPAVRVRPPAPGPTSAEIDELIAAWRAATDADRERATETLLDAGPPAVERLLDLICGRGPEGFDELDAQLDAERLIPRFGRDAVRPLVARLSSDDADTRGLVIELLARAAPSWAHTEDGELVCRALLARLPVPEDAAAAVGALRLSRPAGRCIARELAELWRTGPDDMRSGVLDILVALGPDAAPAAPVAWDELAAASQATSPDADARRRDALRVLAAIGAADPSRLGLVVSALDSKSDAERAAAVGVLGAFGPAAAPAKDRLVALLDDSGAGEAAWHVLAALEPGDDAAWLALVAHDPGMRVEQLAESSDGAARLMQRLGALSGDSLVRVVNALEAGHAVDRAALAAALTSLAQPEGRVRAAELWLRDDGGPPPKEALVLLDDADARVRAATLSAFAETGAIPDAAILARGLELVASPDADMRRDALGALRAVAAREPKALAAIVGALRDPDDWVRSTAARALPDAAVSDPAVRSALMDALRGDDTYVRDSALARLCSAPTLDADARGLVVATIVDAALRDPQSNRMEQRIDELARLDGGLDALARAVRSTLAAADRADFVRRRAALAVAVALAPRVPSLRSDLLHLRDTVEESERGDIDEAVAKIDLEAATDPEAIARAAGDDSRKVERLRALGEEGLRAIILVAAGSERPSDLRGGLADVDLRAEIVAAAGADGPDAAERRKGAAVLAPLLPDADALAVLTKLAPDEGVRAAVVASVALVAKRAPGSVGAPLVVRLLRHADGTRDWRGLSLVPHCAPAVAALDPAVVPDLAKFRDGESPSARVRAAAMIFHLTGRQADALPTFRAVLARPERLTGDLPWGDMGGALSRMQLTADDIAGLLPALQRAASCCEPPEMDADEPEGAREWFHGVLTSIVPALGHCGPAAAAAVPALSMIVSKWDSASEEGSAAIRVLAEIGPAARGAIPELRRALVRGGASDLVRDALRRVEAGPR